MPDLDEPVVAPRPLAVEVRATRRASARALPGTRAPARALRQLIEAQRRRRVDGRLHDARGVHTRRSVGGPPGLPELRPREVAAAARREDDVRQEAVRPLAREERAELALRPTLVPAGVAHRDARRVPAPLVRVETRRPCPVTEPVRLEHLERPRRECARVELLPGPFVQARLRSSSPADDLSQRNNNGSQVKLWPGRSRDAFETEVESEPTMAIDPKQPIPLYFQLKTVLLGDPGAYGRDGQLPTEHELCDRYEISRTPVSSPSELAEEGVILRHRRRGTFVNPHWLRRRPDQPELRIVVPEEGPWARMIRDTPSDVIDVVAVPRPALHQALTHAVAEGRAPDSRPRLGVGRRVRSRRLPYALEDLNEAWVHQQHEVDFIDALVAANRYEAGRSASRRSRTSPGSGTGVASSRKRGSGFPPHGESCAARHERCSRTACLTRSSCRRLARGRDNGLLPDLVPRLERSRRARARRGEPRLAQDRTGVRFLRSLVDDGLMSADVVGYEWIVPYACSPRGRRSASAAATRRRRLPGRSAFRFASSGITSASRPSPGSEGRPRAWQGRWCTGSSVRQLSPRSRCASSRTSSRRRPSPVSPRPRAEYLPAGRLSRSRRPGWHS